ncbi:tRNA epoxyqueuosine(34) reductase QueG [Halalkalibacillus sediminis]|uniref:tRNA epoxyqueuosine(34) reductase QueG n=1 Tax=Halalkalibacillus sediminis TaxID=2018042 RepID=A0A2I0QV49_9BACI|nr:tRNA epoxyqueuosine(34) reductase QueG [Halalkalibacillus sediminis]PKR78222.1 tRNA epoxyqueuosine(34) reductase QueG [Halalkalibacillus sediminis]
MDVAQLKQELIEYSKEINIQEIGFTSADTFDSLKQRLIVQQSLKFQSGFEKGSVEERTTPSELMPKARSIISIALAYPSKMKGAPKSTKQEPRGVFARASWGQDYHDVLREKLRLLGEFLQEKVDGVAYKAMVDTGELHDRAVAERAGVGFVGKNCALITEDYGSYVYLGELITNIPFQPDEPIEEGCGDCNICVDTCPTGALVQGGQLNAQRCIAYLTLTKGFLEDEFRTKIGNRVYGCDTCQVVCPKNKSKDFHLHPEMEPDPELVKPKLQPLLKISNREFKEKYGYMSGSWRGKKPIQRNAIIALAHYKNEDSVDDLADLMNNDPRPVIRGTAAWAIGKIGRSDSEELILKAKERESDEQVINEMEKGLSFKHQTV